MTIIGCSERWNLRAGTRRHELIIGDLKLFEPRTMCPIIAVRDREGR